MPEELRRRLRRFGRHRLAACGTAFLVLLVICAVAAPWVAPHDYALQNLDQRLVAPGPGHWLGTDGFGRDVLSRIIWGARVSLQIGLMAAGLSLAVGVLVGSAAGYFGGAVDVWLSRFMDVFIAIPALFMVLVLVAFFGASTRNTMLVIGFVYWPSTARVVRAEFLSLRSAEFTQAARALGARSGRIIWRHLLPNALSSLIVQASLFVAEAILLESGLSYLGVGAQPPVPSWGNMLVEGRRFLTSAWWIATFPGMVIFFTVLSLNLMGDGLRDTLDPRQR
jgi:peptide/nickel transport system permease protein